MKILVYFLLLSLISISPSNSIEPEYRSFSPNSDDKSQLIKEGKIIELINEKTFNEYEMQARKDKIETDDEWREQYESLLDKYSKALDTKAFWSEYIRKTRRIFTIFERMDMNRQRYLINIKTIPVVFMAVGHQQFNFNSDERSPNDIYEYIRNVLIDKLKYQHSKKVLSSKTSIVLNELKENIIVTVKSIEIHQYEKAPVRHRKHLSDNIQYQQYIFQLYKILPLFEEIPNGKLTNISNQNSVKNDEINYSIIKGNDDLNTFFDTQNLEIENKKISVIENLLKTAKERNDQASAESKRFNEQFMSSKNTFIKELNEVINELNSLKAKMEINKIKEVLPDGFPILSAIHSSELNVDNSDELKNQLRTIQKNEKKINNIYNSHIKKVSNDFRSNYKTREVVVFRVMGRPCQDNEKWGDAKSILTEQIYKELQQSLRVLKHYSFLKVELTDSGPILTKAKASTYYSEPKLIEFWLAVTSINRKIESEDTPYLKILITLRAKYIEEFGVDDNVYRDVKRNVAWLKYQQNKEKISYNKISMMITDYNAKKQYGFNRWRLPSKSEIKSIIATSPIDGKCSIIPINIPCNILLPTGYIQIDEKVEVINTSKPALSEAVDDTKALNFILVAPLNN